MDIAIRACTLSDLGVVVELFEQYRAFYRMPRDRAEATRFLRARLESGDSVIFLAEDSVQQPVGFVQLYPMFSSTRMAKLWVLNDLFVIRAARCHGVGRALMEAARRNATRQGVKIMALATERNNTKAKRLYESLGYRLDTVFDHYELAL